MMAFFDAGGRSDDIEKLEQSARFGDDTGLFGDAWLIGLIPGVAAQAGARNGFAEPRDRAPKIAAIAPPGNAETARPRLEGRVRR